MLVDACAGHGDCPPAAPVCAADDGLCVGCLHDADCPASQRCFDGICGGSWSCDGDASCPGEQTCGAEGECLPAPALCPGDRFDPAGPGVGPTRLQARAYTGLWRCDGADDEYSVTVPAGMGLEVTLWHAPAAGDLALRLFVPGGGAVSSDAPFGFEQAALPPGPEARAVVVRVGGRAGWSTPYSLDLAFLPADWCVPDEYEGLTGNDQPDFAAPLGAGGHATRLCRGEEDFYSLPLAAGTSVQVRAESDVPDPGLFSVELLGPAGAPLASAAAEGAGRLLSARIESTGRYLLRVASRVEDRTLELSLEVAIEPAAAGAHLACGDAPELLPGVPLRFERTLPVRVLGLPCAAGLRHEVVARFDVPAASTVGLTLSGPASPYALALLSDCGEEPALCLEPGAPALRDEPLAAGTWYLALAYGGGGPPELTLHVQQQQPCGVDGECLQGRVCLDGLCRLGCQIDADCPGRQVCEPDSGRCQDAFFCEQDLDCAANRVCLRGSCLQPDCTSHHDCGGRRCVDRRCELSLPGVCADDEGCSAPQVCLAAGACGLPEGCADDGDCPATRPRCDEAVARCVACRGDSDCAATQICQDRACSAAKACADALDCPGERVCDAAGQCLPAAGCPGDRFDPLANGEPIPLPLAAYTDLLLCDGTQDRYSVELPQDEGLVVRLHHDPRRADLTLGLGLLDGGGQGPLQIASGPTGVQRLTLAPGPQARRALVEVRGEPGVDAPYQLILEPLDAPCAPDRFEGAGGNDHQAAAAALVPGVHAVTLCGDDEDWWRLRPPVGVLLEVHLDVPGGPEQVPELVLFAPDGTPLARVAGDQDEVRLSATVTTDGVHLLRLAAGQAALPLHADLELRVQADAEAEATACSRALELVVGEPLRLPYHAPDVPRFEPGCAAPAGGDHVARFELDEPTPVTLMLMESPFGATWSFRRDCADPGSELACELEPTSRLLEAGTYFVVVSLPPGLEPTLLLLSE